MIAAGTVTSLHRWPVKSFGGEPADALRIDGRGAGGDRAQALLGIFGGKRRPLTVRQVPRMLAWAAAYPQAPGDALDPDAPPLPVVTGPDGRAWDWDDPGLPGALRDDLGRPVDLVRDLALMPDLPDSLLITVEASRVALEVELGTPVDLRRFRTNLHVELDAPAFAEASWQGRHVRVGEAELELLHPCERCAIPTRDPDTSEKWPQLLRHLAREHDTLFGINARAVRPATVRLGDPVAVV
jgi:MOSC domain-containing protein